MVGMNGHALAPYDADSNNVHDKFEAEVFEKNERKNRTFKWGSKRWGLHVNPVSFLSSVVVVWGFAVRCHPPVDAQSNLAKVLFVGTAYDCFAEWYADCHDHLACNGRLLLTL